MHRSRSVFVVLSLLVAGSLTPALAQSSEELAKKVEELEKKVESLEKQINYLEGYVGRRLNSFAEKLAQGGGAAAPNAALETEAQQALSTINQAMSKGDYDTAKSNMAEFMKKYGSTTAARTAQRLQQELSVIGKEAPTSWGIEKWFQGENEIDLAGKGTKLLVFWEVWCPHCKREVPKVQALYDSLKGSGLEVVGLTKITKSSTEEKVKAFVAESNVGYPVAKENGTVSQHFNVSGIPAAAVVKDGKVVWRGHPARLSEAMLKGWL